MKYRAPLPQLPLAAKQTIAAVLMPLLVFTGCPVSLQAADYYWDQDATAAGNSITGTNLGGTGAWDLSASRWWDGSATSNTIWPNLADTAIFTGTAGTVTLGTNLTAGGLRFNTSGYTITGGVLTLAAPSGSSSSVIAVNGFGVRDTIASQLAGSSQIVKNGDGTLVLSNTANNFTGNLLVNQGALVITDPLQLGSASLISVNGANQVNNTGGTLVLQGGLSGMTLSKNLSLSGRGLNYANSSYAALASIGQNTISGNIAFSNAGNAAIGNAYGNLTLSGTVGLSTAFNSLFGAGNGNTIITGQVTGSAVGTDRFIKTGSNLGTTLWLTNTANNYVSDTRIDSGTVRVSTSAALGASASTTQIDLNGGTLEVLTDSPDFSSRSIRVRDNTTTGAIFVSRALGGSGLNQTVTFGSVTSMAANATLNVTGRDGYNVSIGGGANFGAGTNGGFTFNNNGSGTLTLNTPSLWNNTDATGSRTLTIGGNGETVLTGIINAAPSSSNHVLTKSGSGTFIIQGTSSNFRGAANVTGGTLSISSFGAINNNATPGSGALQLNAGALSFTGAATTGAGETVSKAINLNGTTGFGALLANQSGTSPSALIISNSIAATGGGVKTLFLGGSASSSIVNQVQGVIQNNSGTNTTGLTKVGSATWLYSPSVASYGTAPSGVTVSSGGAAQTNSFTVSSATGLAVGQVVAGTNVPTGAIITNINGNVITINANIGSSIAANTALTFTQNANFTGPVTVGGGTLQVVPTATTGLGSNLFASTQALTFNIDNLTNNGSAGGTFQLGTPSPALTANLTQTMGALTPSAGAGRVQVDTGGASFSNVLNFASLGTRAAGATVTFAPAATNAGIQFAAAPAGVNGILGGYAVIANPTTGAIDFVATPAANTNIAALGATTVLPASAASATANYLLNTAVTTTASQAANSLRITGANTLTLGGGLVLNSGGLVFDNSSGAATISNGGTAANTLGAFSVSATTTAGSATVNLTSGTTAGFYVGMPVFGNANIPAGATVASIVSSTQFTLNSGTGVTAGTGVATGAGTSETVITVGGSTNANALTINAGVSAVGGSLTKTGAGTLVLAGASAYTGTTTINEGTVRLSGSGTLGGTNASLVVRQGATLDLNGVNVGTSVTAGGLNNFSGAGTITNGAASGTAFLRVGNNGGGGTFSGLIQDGANAKTQFVKAGAGTVSLTGTNTFTGGVVITGGVLAVNALPNFGTNGPIGPGITGNNAGSLVFNGGGTLQYTGSNANIYQTTQTPSITTDRLFTIDGTGAVTATIDSSGQFGNNTTAAGNANNAALVFGNTGAIAFAGTGARTIQLTGNSTGDNEFKPLIQDKTAGTELTGVTKAGNGLWILSGANTYSGPTTVTAGALQAVDGTGLPSSSNLTLNGGVFQTTGSFTRALGTGGGQVQFTGNGGFSAGSSPLTVNLGSGATLNLGTAPTLGSTLILSSSTAQADVILTNPINLGTAARTIQVDDNSQSNFDFATVSGVISGGTGGTLTKTGSGLLILGGANTYTGATTVSAGTLVVQSIGASGATATSLGTNVSGGALNLGSGTAAGVINYVGTGETTTRTINIAGTTGGATIDSSGSGPLILGTSVAITGSGAKTLTLRGFNADANSLSSNLNDLGAALAVTKSDSGIWELNGTNGFTGTLTIGGGLLGANSAAALGSSGTGVILFSNGGLYTNTAGGFTIARATQIAGNSHATFTGANPFTLTSTMTGTSAGGNWTINNSITSSAGLTISGNFNSAEGTTQTRSLVIQGTGNTTLSGVLQGTGATNGGVGLLVNTAPSAVTTLSGASPNLLSLGGELRSGILVLDKAQALGPSTTTFDLNGGELRTSSTVAAQTQANVFRLNGSTAIINGSNPLTMSGSLSAIASNRTLQNDITNPAGLTVSGLLNLSADTNARTLTLSGAGTTNVTNVIANGVGATPGASSLVYSGTGSLNLSGAAASTFTGTATFNGGTTTLSGGATLGSTGALAVNQATLTLDNSSAQTNNRLGGRALTLAGATLNVLGNASAGGTEGGTPSTLTIGSGGSTINTTNLAGTNTLAFTALTFSAGGSVNFTGGPGSSTNQVTFSTAPALVPASTGILARATVGGADFATYGANGITAFTGYTNPTDLNAAAATDTVKLSSTTTTGAVTTNKTINALAFNSGAPTVSNTAGTILNLTSGGILATGTGPYTITARTNLGAVEGGINVDSGSTLNLSGAFTGSAGFTKALGGALNITVPQFIAGTQTLNGGTTTLSGGNNTLFPGQAVIVNKGATLDLNGNNQFVGGFGGGNIPGSAGTVTSSSAALFSTQANQVFGGDITGAITLNKTGNTTLTAESPLTYTGATWITGGTLTLRDNATLLNTSAVNINYGTLTLDSNASLQIANNNRLSDTAPISLRGGTLTYQARFATQGTETLGALTLAEGASTLNINAANNAGANAAFLSTDVTFASLTRNAGATVNITANQGFGNNGNANRAFFTTAPSTLANGMLGAWAIANTTDFAGYDPTLGVGAIGYGGFRGYDLTFASGNITQFINNATPTVTNLASATTTTGALRLGGVSQNDITFSSGSNVLVLESGGLLRSNQAAGSNIGTTASRGVLTAGTGSAAELVIYSAATGTLTSAATATTVAGSNVITTVPSTVGLAPGQTITTANLPAGTFIVSIDSPTQITVSQNATASASTNALVTGRDSVVVNSVISDNGSGVVTLVKSGAGTLNLSASNTYTGGTIINQGTVNLIGSGTVLPAGGVTLNGATLALNTNAGQIAASNTVTLNDSSTLTLVGNNSLSALTFNNTGGTGIPTVTTGGTLTLTGSSPVTVTSNNVSTLPVINGTVNLTAGAKTFSIGAIQVGGQTISAIAPALNIAATINGIGTSITKTGNGILQLSGANTFTGGIDLQAGGLVVGSSSSPTAGGAGTTSGPFGSGSITAAAGTTFLANNSQTFNNAVAFAGTPTFDATANTVWTLTLGGAITGAGWTSTPTVNVINPSLTVQLLGTLPAFSSITKTGAGTLIFNSTSYSGNYDARALGAPLAVSLLHDGTSPNIGNSAVETISLGSVTFDTTGTGTITVNRAGGTLPYATAANKILAPSSINTVLTSGLIVANTNGYGLQVSDAGALTGTPTFTVNTASNSNVTQGLYLTGALSGTGFTKAGPGAAVLGNASNSFTGNINIGQGVIAAAGNGQLGNAANIIQLNPTTGTSTFRATGTYTLANPLQLSNTANTRAIEVTGGNTLTLNTPFDLNSGAGNSAGLTKADNGTLRLAADNSAAWAGVLTISQGAVEVGHNGALGTTAGNTVVGASGAALRLPAGFSVAEPLNLTGTGILTGGALQGTGSGTSTASGAITLAGATAIGADAGNTLNITGGISGAQALTFAGAGNINLTSGALGAVSSVTKIGSGTTTLGINSTSFVGALTVNNGTFVVGSASGGTVGGTGAITATQGGTLTVDNTTSPAPRLGGRPVTVAGGTLNYNTNSGSAFTETAGILTVGSGASTINMSNSGSALTTLTFASLAAPGTGSAVNFTGLNVATNQVKFTTAPTLVPATTGILPRFTVAGTEFATYNATNGIVPFTGYAAATNILSAGATQTYLATAAKSNSLTGNQTLNALTLESGPLDTNVPNVGGLGGLNPTTLTLTSGAILARGSGAGTTSAISVPIVALGTTEGVIHVTSGQTLNITSGFSGSGGMIKALAGTLNLNQPQFVTGTTTVNGGTLNLQSGATNTLLFNNNLTVNTGATVDLKSGAQFIANLASQGAAAGADVGGGIITNSGAQATLVANANSVFGGSIQGTVFFNKTGVNGLTFTNAQTYTGDTLINGGTLTLADSGSLAGTSGIAINYGGLTLTNTNLADNGDRVPSVPLSLRGGIITFNGRAQSNSSETLGALTLLDGHSQIVNANGGTGINSSTLTFSSLTRSGSAATLRFDSRTTTLGTIGSNARTLFTTAPTLTNNIIGPWAIVDREFASYDATYGVGALNQTGFAGYSGFGLNSGATSSDNVRLTTSGTTTLLGNTSVNTLTFGQQGSTTTLNLGGNTLTIAGGGLLFGQATDNVNFGITNGNLTGPTGGGDLFIHHANYSGTNRTASIDAAIVDNGGPIRVIKTSGDTGASVMTLNGTNTYTGGTVVNMGTLILGATSTLGSGGITVNQGTLTQTAGAVIPSQTLTLGGGSTVTLAGNNSLSGITVNNLGGAAPTLTPTGTLTLTGGISATTSNAGAVATIGTGTLDLNGAGSYAISVGKTLVNSVDVAPWQAGLIINSVITNGGISKSGDGILQLGGASTFTGGVNITSGGLIIAGDTNSTVLGDPVVSGPVGTGTLTFGANTTVLAGGAARTITNNVVFSGDTVFNGINNLTFNGVTTLPSVWNATVTAPQMTVTIGDATPAGSTYEINKSGLGILSVGSFAGTINAVGGLLFSADGNALGTQESLSLGSAINIDGDTSIIVNRSGGAPNARNKILQQTNLTNGGSIMSVANQSGYGLEFTGTTTLNGASHFAVTNATASDVVQGLILSGVVSDGGGYDLTKSGAGTLVLGNPSNTFGGTGKTIDILGGIVSAGSDGALGDSGNQIRLNADAATGAGFRATGSFATNRTFVLNQPNNAIEVTAGYMLELDQPFSVTTATNALNKNDNGVVAIDANNTGWTGAVNINAGAVRAKQANALGSGTVTVTNAIGSALQLEGASVANPIVLATNGASGFDNRGAIEAVGGVTSTVTGLITQNSGNVVTYGAAASSTLNINGSIATSNSTTFYAGTGGVVNLNSVYGNGGAGGPTITKTGPGTLNVTVNQPSVTSALSINQGAVNVSGSGVGIGTTGLVTINANGTLSVDDTSGAASAHLGGRALTLQGGTFNYTGNSANSSETLGILTFSRMGGVFTSTQTSSGTVALTFTSLGLGSDASANFQGNNLGTANNRILFTTAPTLTPATTGILARATVNGADFATYGATNGIAAFSAYNPTSTTNINSAGATDTVDANAAMTTKSLTANKTINALRLSGSSAQTVGGANFNQLTLTAGGLLATGNTTHVVNVPVVSLAAVQGVVHVNTGSTLNLQSTLTGTGGLVKDGAGTLIVSSPASSTGLSGVNANTLTGNVTIARGTVQLNGGRNTLTPGQFIVMGGPGATLDLNGNSQQIAGLMTDTTAPGSGGLVTNTSGTMAQIVVNQDNSGRNFAGSLTGLLNFVRSGQNTLTLHSASSFTGTTTINGGTTTLQSDGAFTGTSAIDINYATLTLDNNAGFNGLADRINDSAAITMRGATLTFQGRAQTASTETLGAVSASEGFNVINATVGGTGVNSVDLTLNSLSRPANSAATLIVQGGNGMGTIGSNARVYVNTLNGVATTPVTYSANGSGLTNNIVGGWAISSTNEFLSYIPGLGLASLNQTGAAQYDLNNTFVGSSATDNVRLTATTAIPNGGATVNAVSMTASNIALNFATGTDTLNLTSGGLIGPNNNQSIGATLDSGRITAGGLTPAANSDLYLFNRANTLTLNSRIIDNPNGSTSSVRAVLTAAGGTITLVNPNNSYTGGTVVNGGTLNLTNTAATPVIPAATVPANGLVINGATVTMNNFAGQIASANIVTVNDGGILNLYGNNTLAGLVFTNTGGTTTPSVNSFVAPTATVTGGSTGVLTIGSSGVTATSMNVTTTSQIAGRVDFGSSSNTINVAPISVNGVDVAPLQAALVLQGVVGSSGGITKTGSGVLQFSAPAVFTGATTVSAGGIRTGVANAGSRFSALTLGSGTSLNLAGVNALWGSLAGSGMVFNSSATNATLITGFDNSSTTFSGQLARFNDAAVDGVALQKIGTGTLSLTGVSTTRGAVTVSGGTLRYVDSGAAFTGSTASGAGTFTVQPNATLALDNSGTANVNNRLGSITNGTLNLGGKLTVNGSSTASTPTTETIATVTVTNGSGRIELTPNAANPLTLAIGTLTGQNSNGSAVFAGITGAAAANGVANLTITTPNLLSGQGTGANGTATMPVRSDILADPSPSGLGAGFLVRDSATGSYRALGFDTTGAAVAGEFEATANTATVLNWGATENIRITGAQSLFTTTPANTITASGTAGISSGLGTAFGIFGPNGAVLTQTLNNASGLLVLSGTTTVNTALASATAGTTPTLHVLAGATLNLNGPVGIGGTAGFLKADGGDLNINNRAFYTGGATTINGGTVTLNSGFDNTLAVVPGATTPTVNAVTVNPGGTLNLNGRNQAIGSLASNNILPGQGGTVTSTGAATLTSTGGGNFGGAINGAISFTRAGNNTTLLTSANGYTGATIVRGGTLQLRDSGSILSTSSISLQYGTLQIDQSFLNPSGDLNPTRVASGTAITMQGGGLTLTPGGSVDSSASLGTVTLTGGANTITPTVTGNTGTVNTLTLANLVTTSGATLNINAATGQVGINQARLILTQVNGATPANNSVFGPNIIVNSGDYGAYVTGQGVGALGSTGFPAYGAALASGANTPTVINSNTAALTIAANTTTGSLKFGTNATTAMTFTAGTEVLNLALGGLLSSNNNNAVNIGTSALRGVITTGGTATTGTIDLVAYQAQSTTTIESIIQNNGLGATTRLVKSGAGALTLTAQNTYTGGTVVNQGTLNLTGTTAGFVVIPAGGLTINNATVTQNTNAQQIATSTDVTINGAGVLTLTGANTLNSLTWNNTGGTANPSVNGGSGLLTLTSATPITATNDSFATTPVLSGAGGLALSNAAPAINVSGLSPNSLQISAVISSAGGAISKTGAGALSLSGANTFTTGFNLNAGSLIFAAATAGTVPNITSGPVGTGTLTIAGGTSILSDGTSRTIGNAVTVNGDFTFGGRTAGNNVTLSGAVNLGSAGRTITVDSPAVTATISGAITSTATGTAFTKAGEGTLILSSTGNNFGGAGVAITGGLLKGVTNDNVLPVATALSISSGAGYDLNSQNQTIDSLSGSGFVTNSANNTRTLTISSTANNSTFDGVLTDNRILQTSSLLAVTKNGAGTNLTLTGSNTHNGTTTVTAGTLTITNGSALGTTVGNTVVSSGAALQVQNNITSAEPLSLTGTGVSGNGALRNLSGSNTMSGTIALGTGGATVQSDTGGQLTLSGVISGSQPMTIQGGGTTVLSAANTYTGLTTIAAGSTRVQNNAGLGTTAAGTSVTSGGNLQLENVAIGTEALTLNGSGISGTGALTATGTSTYAGTVSLASDSTIGVAASGDSLTLSGVVSGSGGLAKAGAGTVTLSGANTYTGATGVSAGVLQVGNGTTGALSSSSAVSTSSGATLRLNLVNSGIFTNNVANDGTVNTVSANTNTLSGIISGNGGLSQSGTGTTILTGANTYTGSTNVTAGILQVGNGTAGSLSASSAVSTASGSTLRVNLANSTTFGSNVTNNGTLNTSGSNTYTLSGAISGGGSLSQSGTGTTILTGANTYTGATSVTGGNLQIGDGTSGSLSGSSAVSTASGTTLRLNLANGGTFSSAVANAGTINAIGGNANTVSGAISGAGSFTQSGSGVTFLSGTNTYTGATSVTGGTLVVQNAAALGASTAGTSVSSGASLRIDNVAITSGEPITINGTGAAGAGALQGSGNASSLSGIVLASNSSIGVTAGTDTLTLSGTLSGAGSLEKAGAGTVSLEGANTYSGNTLVSGGTLFANNTSGSATSSGTVTVGDGSGSGFEATLGGTGTITGTTTITSTGRLTAGGYGTTGTLTFSGGLTSDAGSTWLVDLAGGDSPVSDLIDIAGVLTLNDALLTFNDSSWKYGNRFTIAKYGSLSGSGLFFWNGGALNQGAVFSTSLGDYQINYQDDGNGGIGNRITATAVPEPSQVIAIVLLLALGLWFGRRRLRGAGAVAVEG